MSETLAKPEPSPPGRRGLSFWGRPSNDMRTTAMTGDQYIELINKRWTFERAVWRAAGNLAAIKRELVLAERALRDAKEDFADHNAKCEGALTDLQA